MKDKKYKLCIEACEKEGCYCPEDYKFHSAVADTPPFIRAYFYLKGIKEGKKAICNYFFKGFKNPVIVERQEIDKYLEEQGK